MTKRNFKSLIALVLLTLFLQACSTPPLQQSQNTPFVSVEDQTKTIVVQTLTAQGSDIQPITEEAILPTLTLTPTETPKPTDTLTPTPTPIYDWTGTWKTSFGRTGYRHVTWIVTFNQTDNKVSGSFIYGERTITLEGSLSSDWQLLTGTWDNGTSSGPFELKMVSVNQFIGNQDNGEYEWCGVRNRAGFPSPCMGP